MVASVTGFEVSFFTTVKFWLAVSVVELVPLTTVVVLGLMLRLPVTVYAPLSVAFAGTMTRLKIIVNASSDERNFFIIFFILSHFCDLAPRAQSLSHTSAFYHAAGNKGTEKCKIHKFFIFPFARLPLSH